eukprot:5649408-Alexandrium_andersonii.AAC.1
MGPPSELLHPQSPAPDRRRCRKQGLLERQQCRLGGPHLWAHANTRSGGSERCCGQASTAR